MCTSSFLRLPAQSGHHSIRRLDPRACQVHLCGSKCFLRQWMYIWSRQWVRNPNPNIDYLQPPRPNHPQTWQAMPKSLAMPFAEQRIQLPRLHHNRWSDGLYSRMHMLFDRLRTLLSLNSLLLKASSLNTNCCRHRMILQQNCGRSCTYLSQHTASHRCPKMRLTATLQFQAEPAPATIHQNPGTCKHAPLWLLQLHVSRRLMLLMQPNPSL